jgi:predicted nucleic acid-binding protein
VIRVIVDTGPIVALLNRRDRYHPWAREVMDTLQPPLYTCESVVSEAGFLLSGLEGGADAVLNLLQAEVLKVDFRLEHEIRPIRGLMRKFASVPMSLADACLVRMSEIEPETLVLTLDNDFRAYRRNKRHVIPAIMPPERSR